MTERQRRLLVDLPVILAAAYFAMWACAPAMSGPPAVPMAPDVHNEIGVGIDWGEQLEARNACGTVAIAFCNGPSGQVWYRHSFGRMDLGGIAFGGTTTLVGLGGALRVRLLPDDAPVQLALALDLGWMWAALGVPVMFQVAEHDWLYVTPSIGARQWNIGRATLGYHHRQGNFIFGVELNSGYSSNPDTFSSGYTADVGAFVGAQF